MNLTGILLSIVGILYLIGAGFDVDGLMDSYRMRIFSRIFGSRARSRIFFMFVGAAILTTGLLGIFGVIDLPN